eukprot:scaffold8648_cov126-Isochrysis_galbana.AAC.1
MSDALSSRPADVAEALRCACGGRAGTRWGCRAAARPPTSYATQPGRGSPHIGTARFTPCACQREHASHHRSHSREMQWRAAAHLTQQKVVKP